MKTAQIAAVVFVAAFIGAFGGVYMAGSPFTKNLAAADAGSGSGAVGNNAPTPSPQPVPSGGVSMSALQDDDPAKGDENALVTIVEFSDFQCPFCRRSFEDYTNPGGPLEKYIAEGKVRLVYRDFPLSFHPGAQPTAEAAECADDQGLFWQFHDVAFQEQAKQGQGTIQFGNEDIKSWASQVDGLDYGTWETCFDSGKHRQEVQKDFADGSAAGVSGTPTFFIGATGGSGQKIVGAQPWQVIEAAINSYI